MSQETIPSSPHNTQTTWCYIDRPVCTQWSTTSTHPPPLQWCSREEVRRCFLRPVLTYTTGPADETWRDQWRHTHGHLFVQFVLPLTEEICGWSWCVGRSDLQPLCVRRLSNPQTIILQRWTPHEWQKASAICLVECLHRVIFKLCQTNFSKTSSYGTKLINSLRSCTDYNGKTACCRQETKLFSISLAFFNLIRIIFKMAELTAHPKFWYIL